MGKIEIQYIPSKEGEGTIEVNGYLLHSKYAPIKEAQRFVEKEIDNELVTVIFGLGKGYILSALEEKNINPEKIVIVEPIIQLESISSDKYTVLKGETIERISEIIEKKLTYYSREVKVISLPNYDKLCTEEYKKLLQAVKDIQWLNIVNDNTVRGQSLNWQKNGIRNSLYAYMSSSLKELKKYYSCPVVIASGGPSLTKQLPLLRENRANIILIAAGSTVNTLMKANLEPDYIVSIDGGEVNFKVHFEHLKVQKAKLIYSFSSHYKIQQGYKGGTYAFVDSHEHNLQNHLMKNYDIDLPMLRGGGSVANFSLTVARYISSGPIALIGQDLAYTDGKTHAENNKNAKEASEAFLKSRGAVMVEGYYGDNVVTDYSLISMKESFEILMKEIENSERIYNCTEGGAKIFGMQQISFEEFCKSYVLEESVSIYNSPVKERESLHSIANQYLKEIRTYNLIIIELKKIVKALQQESNKLEFSPQMLKLIDKSDKALKRLLTQVVMDRIIDPITLDVMSKYTEKKSESKEEKFLRVYEQSYMLYSRLLEATEQTKSFTEKALTELRLRTEEQ